MVKSVDKPYGYWIDLEGVQFEENATSQWVHAMPVGEVSHPVYGKISFTADRLKRFADNVNQRVRGHDIDIDYDHKAMRTDAAGWVTQAQTRTDGLWLLVDWTAEAAQKIKDRAFRYFSPEFRDSWQHPQTGHLFKDVLFGGGITNRPFLKDMIPLNLHELCTGDNGGQMNRALLETIARGYSIQFSDDTSDEELQTLVTAEAAKAAVQAESGSEEEEEETAEEEEDESEGEGEGEKHPEGSPEQQLSERAKTDPVLAMLLSERAERDKRIAELETANRLSENARQLSELREGSGKRKLSPAAEKQLSELTAGLPKEAAAKVFSNVKTILSDGGIVELGEQGRSGPGTGSTDNDSDPVTAFDQAVNKYLSEAKSRGEEVEWLDAVSVVSSQEPELFAAYRDGSYAFKE